ncbi:DUF1822 family protein [Nostoc sp. NMS8]|uniref:DUF1822 family protein n=1 Tax=Nostoc sp. NMS8 TaxID=2815392 RepID=UPI0025FF8A37|nr:DUF1822 family protein [Nostoc sp. NMS8]MBN3958726.1 DUF1822 family protein [Nostoc sp. NMS8]
MINQPSPQDFSDLLDWRSLKSARTELLPEHFQQAARLSKLIYLPQQRWQVYLSALAVLGFEQWLKERAPDLHIQTDSASIWQPAYANLLAVAYNIRVGDFKICLITSSNLTDQHSVPFAAFDIPDFAAHFYVLMQVEEEEQQVAVSSFMNYEQYDRYQTAAGLEIDADWTYTLPSTWFNPDSDALLLNLRCLQADAIKLPTLSQTTQNNTVFALRQKLINLISQLKNKYIWQVLTVKEGTILLSNPDLVNLAYKGVSAASVQPLINVGLWLRDRIDGLAQELGWMLMPLPVLSGMRSLQDEFDQIRAGLEQQGVHIPPTARGAYRDLESEQGSVRMYVIMWVLSETTEKPEWMLLVALGSQPQAQMPKTLKLEVRDEAQILFGESLQGTSQGILYAQVIGDLDEKFWVTVTADDAVFEIPPFGLELEK